MMEGPLSINAQKALQKSILQGFLAFIRTCPDYSSGGILFFTLSDFKRLIISDKNPIQVQPPPKAVQNPPNIVVFESNRVSNLRRLKRTI